LEPEIRIPGPCINFKVAVLFRLMAERYRSAYAGLNLTNEQVRMLLNLKMGGPCNQQSLAKRLELEKSTFSRTLQAMVQKGFIKRKDDTADKRNYVLSLSEKGEKKAAAVIPVWKKIHEETQLLFGQASVQELDRMLRILKTTS
jgi:DNA-binding MarR family transcriptional regulator